MRDHHISRTGLCALVALLLGASLASPVSAGFPEKAIEIIAPANPGGGWDLTSRSTAKVLAEEKLVTQPIAVSNMPGGSGAVAISHAITKRKGDGHLLIAASPALTFTLALKRVPYTYKDVTPIAAIATDYGTIVVRKDSPHKSLKDLLEAYRKNPADVSVAGGSAPGGQDHVKFAKVIKAAGMDPTKVKYVPHQGGGEAMASLLGGHTVAASPDISEIVGQVEAGEVRVLAVLSDKRLGGSLKNIPTAVEQGVNATYILWRGFYAAPDIPKEAADFWVTALGKMVKTEGWKKTLQANKWFDYYVGGAEYARFLNEDLESGEALLKELGFLK
ncbi:MAG TPA: tripartite tricarboxylate transporter substrate binding protein [Candidatus Methylomirabilis sp.]|nr:tripartite tricarboxylate transporter substrate binding protein [Candidatus Methylomirabilis sp.]